MADTISKYISLNEAAEYSGYSGDYLRLRIRQGKLKGVKIARNWLTTKEWLDEYLERVNNYKNSVANRGTNNINKAKSSPIFTFQPVRKARLIAVACVLFFILGSVGTIFAYPYLMQAMNSATDFVSDTATQFSLNVSEGIDSANVFVRDNSNKLAADVRDFSNSVSTNIRQLVLDTGEEITRITDNVSEDVSDFGTSVFIGGKKGIENFEGNLKFGLAFLREEVDENLVLPFEGFISFFKNRSEPEMTFTEYIQNDIQNLKDFLKGIPRNISYKIASSYQNVKEGLKGIGKDLKFRSVSLGEQINESLIQPTKNAIVSAPGKIARAIASPFVKTYQFVAKPWSEKIDIDEEELEKLVQEIIQQRPEISTQEIEDLRAQITKLKEEGIVTKEIIKEVTKITQIEPVKEITKEKVITKIDDEELKKLKSQIAGIQEWETDIKTLQVLTSKLQTNPPYTQITTAPIYIASQGLQVEGIGIFSSLGVSGSAGITNLGVGDSTSLGSDSSDKLTVQATAEFFSPVTIQNTFTVGDATNYLTIDSTGNLTTTGNLTASGDVTISGASTFATTTISYLSSATGNISLWTNDSGYITGNESITILGDATGSGTTSISVSVTDLTITSEATGSLVYFNGSNWANLAAGTDAHVLTMSSNVPAWAAAAGGGLWTATNGNIHYNTGNVGIGTSTPASLLEIYDTDASAQLTITVATSNDIYDPQIVFRTGASPATKFVLGVDYSDSNKFKIATSSLDTDAIFTIDQSGNVGIGTTSPGYKLDVAGIVNATQFYQGGSLLISGHWTKAVNDIYYNTGNVGIGTSTPSTKLHILGSGTQLRIATSTSVYADFTFDSDGYLTIAPTSGILSLNTSGVQNKLRVYSTGANYIEMYHDGTNAIVFANTGNIEMGATGTDVLIGDFGTASNLVFEESSSIHGQGKNTISLGISGDIFNLNISGVTYNYGGDISIAETLTVSGTTTLAVSSGRVGIGTSTPIRKLEILDASNPQIRITQADSYYTEFKVDASGDLRITASGGGSSDDDIKMIASNLWVCSGDSIDSYSCPSLTLSDTGNLVVKGDIYVEGAIKECADGYIRIPGNPYFGTSDFCVMKYEAKSCVNETVSTDCSAGTKSDGSGDPIANEFAASYPENKPWVSIPQNAGDDLDAQTACERIGTGYHLMTKEEAQTINRYIADNPQNWVSGEVGSGCMYGGHMDNAPTNSLAATNDDMNGWYGTGENPTQAVVCPFSTGSRGKEQRRTMYLPSGDVIWDWSGNVREWLDETCTQGTGNNAWHNSAWIEWSDANLDDYERNTLGPVSNALISNPGGTGKYYGCTAGGNGFERGGYWAGGVAAGVFALALHSAPSYVDVSIGIRCVR